MIRVLHVLGGLGSGGVEALIMNWYRVIDRSKIQFDFLVRSNDNNYEEQIHQLGGEIYYSAQFPRHAIQNYHQTDSLLKTGKWAVVHVHGNAALYLTALELAKKYGVPCRIMHSHSVKAKNNLYSLVHYMNRPRLNQYTTERLACSTEAGKWMYGSGSFQILKNAVDVDSFLFSEENRKQVRNELGLEGRFVVGHVGRFVKSKNHMFLLEILDQIRRTRSDAALLLIGDGELRLRVEDKAKAMGLSDAVLFAGRRNDVNRIMSAMDVFVFPSMYEGLPIALVEAQANGMPCFASKEIISGETMITSKLHPVSLTRSAGHWAKQILAADCSLNDRTDGVKLAKDCGYDITAVVSELQKLYENGARGVGQ